MKVPSIARAALLLLALLPILLAPADRAGAQETVGIAAVVNNEAISIPDLVARIDIAVVASRLRVSEELRRQLAPPSAPLTDRRTIEGTGSGASWRDGQRG